MLELLNYVKEVKRPLIAALKPTVTPLYLILKSYFFSFFSPTRFLPGILYCLIFYTELTAGLFSKAARLTSALSSVDHLLQCCLPLLTSSGQ